MAKKKAAARRATPKRAARGNRSRATSRKGGPAATASTRSTRSRLPRQQALIQDSRIRPLDNAIDGLNDRLDTIATESTAAKTDRATILRLMKEHRVTSYSRGGRRFARVPGDEKLMISKASGDSDTSAPADEDQELIDDVEEALEDETGEADEDLDADNQGIAGEND